MRKIITFLGKYLIPTNYSFQGRVYSGSVFPQALLQFVVFDQMLVFSTEEAIKHTWPALAALDDERICCIPIARGETTEQMWDIFDTMTREVEQGETVIFDITHGLRSLPFLVFLFAAYLKTAKQVTIEAIYYGAFELGDREAGVPAPVIDLSGFITMLDWLTASDQFIQSGDARRLASLFSPASRNMKAARTAANTLTKVSHAAFLCQPFTLMKIVQDLPAHLQAAEVELAQIARPFELLREQITQAYTQFQADPQDLPQVLRSEYRLIQWYYQNNQLIQAMTLAREWLIDAATHRLGAVLDLNRKVRSEFERGLSGLPKVGGQHPDGTRTFTRNDLNRYGREIYDHWPERELIQKTWHGIETVRNQLDHAEHQKNPPPLRTIQKQMDRVVMPGLKSLAQAWGLD